LTNTSDLTPEDVVNRKRELDATVESYSPFFSMQFHSNYHYFMEASFKEMGQSTQIRTTSWGKKQDSKLFTHEDNTPEIWKTYYRLMEGVAKELDVAFQPPDFSPSPAATH